MSGAVRAEAGADAAPSDPLDALAAELARIDALPTAERAALLERVHRAVVAELAALDEL